MSLVILGLCMIKTMIRLFVWYHFVAFPLAILLSYCKCVKNLSRSLNFYLCWDQPCGSAHYTVPAGVALPGTQPALLGWQELFQLHLYSKRRGSGWPTRPNSGGTNTNHSGDYSQLAQLPEKLKPSSGILQLFTWNHLFLLFCKMQKHSNFQRFSKDLLSRSLF